MSNPEFEDESCFERLWTSPDGCHWMELFVVEEESGGRVILHIDSDEGRGRCIYLSGEISPEEIRAALERFSRLQRTDRLKLILYRFRLLRDNDEDSRQEEEKTLYLSRECADALYKRFAH